MEQIAMAFGGRGGARKGAGRPRTRDPGVSHSRRAELSGREPVHVTLSFLDHVWNLRTNRGFAAIRAAFVAASLRADFRVVGLSIQDRHLHLLVEAANAAALARGIHGLKIRLAAGLNRLMGRSGPVFEERYHEHVLSSPTEVRNTQAYVLHNAEKHAAEIGRSLPQGYVDPFSIGYFGATERLPAYGRAMVHEPRTWLLRRGWSERPIRLSASGPRRGSVAGCQMALFPPGVPVGCAGRRERPLPGFATRDDATVAAAA